MIRKRVEKRAKEIIEEYQIKKIKIVGACSYVNFFGKESLGMRQIRGMGNLFLTEDELFFEMWKPRRELHISLSSITGCEITKWHLRKTKGTPLLKVRFTNENGKPDSAAWIVKNLHEWKKYMDNIIRSNLNLKE